ncbi:MAG: hypothetical protein LN588_05140 [Rickettsia endosymbiont of Bryobia graminum]|nr:hypothetical protein [Rickettsia endosymbiont of Bryobia graminum]
MDIVESYIKEHPESKNRKLYFTEEEVLSDTERKLMKEVGDDVPCLIAINILSRCKNYLHQHPDYQKDLENYLRINSNDQILVNNLMSIDYKDSEPLYN